MNRPPFESFFQSATGNTPYDYQSRLAGCENGRECHSQLLRVPTGLGKTAGVVLAWLWNRIHLQNPAWPRRLVYCLPMRTLVEQTQAEVQKWLHNLLHGTSAGGIQSQTRSDLQWLLRTSPIILMGGEDGGEWDIHPERPAILIGTQDMLLSRALNRGYGMSRYRWPMHFGLLNNDCLWIMDETQLMGVSVETSAQLDGFRQSGWSPTTGPCPTWWMSATLEDARLSTVDHPRPEAGWPTESLSDAERSTGRPKELCDAVKRVSPAPLTLNPESKATYAKQMAALIKQQHQPGTLTLVVVNRVSRARQIFENLTQGKQPLYAREKVALIHSRFRPVDRTEHTRLLFSEGDRIVVATQAVEAGIDVSARLLITELAPWSSLVQRIGRCNRRAEFPDARVLWVDIQPKDPQDDLVLPYSALDLGTARAPLAQLNDASPNALIKVIVQPESVVRPVIRRRDLVDLFDTTPDLCGQDLDVSRYIRDGDDTDVQFFWRTITQDSPSSCEPPPQRMELCRVSIGDAGKFLLGKKTKAWRWNPLDESWETAKSAVPGNAYLVHVESGGYSDTSGWTGDPQDKPTPCPSTTCAQPSYAGDRLTFSRGWQTLEEHTQCVSRETKVLADALAGGATFTEALLTAALWHDVGKAHEAFQAMLTGGDTSLRDTLWAKSDNENCRCQRLGFRHELASALVWLLNAPLDFPNRDLVAYLIAAHHGKVRLSIRSLPAEKGNPENPEALFARGVWHGDIIPPVPDIVPGSTTLDLSYMQMGHGPHGPSWLARTIALRNHHGPFRLAFLETLLRAADARASAMVSPSGRAPIPKPAATPS